MINDNYMQTSLATYEGLQEIANKNPDETLELIRCKTNIGGVFFDGFFDIEHRSDLKITSHPVQMGASISDHAFLEPVELTMTVKMSDCNEDIIQGQFTQEGDENAWLYKRGCTAFQVLQDLQRIRIPLSVHTRLRHYENMLIKSVVAPDDYDKLYGMEATVTLQEIIVAQAETVLVKVSKREQTTGESNSGVEAVEDTSNTAVLKMAGNASETAKEVIDYMGGGVEHVVRTVTDILNNLFN